MRTTVRSRLKLAEEPQEEKPKKPAGPRRRKKFTRFLEEHGDQLVRNPNPDSPKDKVKIRSLQGTDEGEKLLDTLYSKWKKSQKEDRPQEDEGAESSDKDVSKETPYEELSTEREDYSPVEEHVSLMDKKQFKDFMKTLKSLDSKKTGLGSAPDTFRLPDEVLQQLNLPEGVVETMGGVRKVLADDDLSSKVGKPNLSEQESRAAEDLAKKMKEDHESEDELEDTADKIADDLNVLTSADASDEDKEAAKERLHEYLKENSKVAEEPSSGKGGYGEAPVQYKSFTGDWLEKFFFTVFSAIGGALKGMLRGVRNSVRVPEKQDFSHHYKSPQQDAESDVNEDTKVVDDALQASTGCTPCDLLRNYAHWQQKFSADGDESSSRHMFTAMIQTLHSYLDEEEKLEDLKITAEDMDKIDGPAELSGLYSECLRTKGNRGYCARLAAEAFLTAYPDHPFADDLEVRVGSSNPTLIVPPRKPSDFLAEGQYLWAIKEDTGATCVYEVEEVSADYVVLSELDDENEVVDEVVLESYALADAFSTGKLALSQNSLGVPRAKTVVALDPVRFDAVLSLARTASTDSSSMEALRLLLGKAKMDEDAESVIVWLSLPEKYEAVVRNLSKRVESAAKERDIKVVTENPGLIEPHLTLLYIGDTIPPKDIPKATKILADVVSEIEPGPVTSKGISYFDAEEHAVCKVGFDGGWLDELHWRFRIALEEAGFDYKHSFPRLELHATLQYLEPKARIEDIEFKQFSWTPHEVHISHAGGTDDVPFLKKPKKKAAASEDDDPCWDDYEMVGTKPGKGGKKVPNCVPKKKASLGADFWEDGLRRLLGGDNLDNLVYSDDELVALAAEFGIADVAIGWIEAGGHGGMVREFVSKRPRTAQKKNPRMGPDMVMDTDDMRLFFDEYIEAKSEKGGKYSHINFKPPKSVAKAAEKGLDYRSRQSKGGKAGLTPSDASKQGIGSGVQRATNLKNRNNLSPKTVRQMKSFFARHQKNKNVNPKYKGEPWKDKGYVSWLLWGGNAGKAWAEKVVRQMDAADKKKTAQAFFTEDLVLEAYTEYVRLSGATKEDFRDVSHEKVAVIDRGAKGKNWSYVVCPRCGSVETQYLKSIKDAATEDHAPFQCRSCSQFFEVPRLKTEKIRRLSSMPDHYTFVDDVMAMQYVQPHKSRQKPRPNPKSKTAAYDIMRHCPDCQGILHDGPRYHEHCDDCGYDLKIQDGLERRSGEDWKPIPKDDERLAIYAKRQAHQLEYLERLFGPVEKTAADVDDWDDDEVEQFIETAEPLGFGRRKKPTKMQWKKIFKKDRGRRKPKRWDCCTKPRRDRDRRMKTIWVSNCRYRTNHGTRVMKRIVGRGSRPPRTIMLNKRRVRWCQGRA